MDLLARWALRLGRFSERYIPSAFSIAVLLTLLTAALAMGAAHAGPRELIEGWGGGIWSLLTFAMRMALVMFSGYMLAVAPVVSRILERLAALPRTARQAVAFTALASMLLGLINWGLSIVGSAMLVRLIARQPRREGEKVDYRLLVATAYFGLGATWHAGLSASAPLIAATANEEITKQFGVVTIDRTLFSLFSLGLVAATLVTLTVLAWLMHPAQKAVVAVDPARLEALKAFEPPARPTTRSLANWLDHTPWLTTIIGTAGLVYAGMQLASLGWRKIDIDLVNLTFLSLAIILHGRPASVLAAAEEAGTVLSGIVLQFPLYAGIYGIIRKTGLTQIIGDAFVTHSPPKLFAAVIYWYSGVVNYFVPSGGAKWTIEAPYILKAAHDLGVDPATVVLAYSWGDMATDLIQPFWALPLLAVAKLEFKDILGYLLLACVVYVAIVSAAFVVFL